MMLLQHATLHIVLHPRDTPLPLLVLFLLLPPLPDWPELPSSIPAGPLPPYRSLFPRRWTPRLRRPRRPYDVLADMERAQAAVSAGMAACVESLVQEVERACKPAPKVPSPPPVRATRKRGQK